MSAPARHAESWYTLDAPTKPTPKKKKPAKRKRRSPQAPRPLPAPLPPESPSAAETSPEPQPPSAAAYSDGSQDGLTPKSDEPGPMLSAEAERLLSSIPETIGDGTETAQPAEPAGPDESNPIAALMESVAFEEEDIRDTLGELFDWLATRFESDHWKLTERQSRMLAKPAAMMANSLWARLQQYIPDIIARWCETTPGAMAFITSAGLVLVPKVRQQVKVSRARRPRPAMVQPSQAHGTAQPRRAASMIFQEGEAA